MFAAGCKAPGAAVAADERRPDSDRNRRSFLRATLDHCTSKFLTQAGVKNTHIRLENENVHGNGHMMMLEKNSSQVAQVLIRWIDVNVK